MKFANTKEWLDFHTETYKRATSARQFDIGISICSPYGSDGVTMLEGIDIVADTMGLKLCETKVDMEHFKFKYSFFYNGVKFYQLTEERLTRYECA